MNRTTIVISHTDTDARIQFILTSGRSIVRYLPHEYTAEMLQSWAERAAASYERRYGLIRH